MADLHIHTLYSDGTDTAEELLKKLSEKKIGVFSVTDHDNVDFYKENGHLSGLVTGIEFSCRTQAGKCHILGYGFDTSAPEMCAVIEKGQMLRRKKLEKRLEYLETELDIHFDSDEREYLFSLKSAGKPHIAKLIVKKGYSDTIQDAFDKYLKKLPGGNDKLDAKEAVDAILLSGGVPVWAHPLGGEGEKHLTEDEFSEHFGILKSCGIKGLECFYSRYDSTETEFLCGIAEKYGMLKSAGSDYHGSVKNIEVGTLGIKSPYICDEMITVLKYVFVQ